MIGKIYITGLIGSLENEVGVELIDVISQVKRQPEATSYEVYINSEGGVVDVGFDIFNYLKSLGLPITTIGKGLVASIATVIFMAGNKRIVAPNTEFMIHLPMGGINWATATEMEDYTKVMKQVESEIISFYTKQLGIGKEAIEPLLKNETWLTEDQLLDLGFVTSKVQLKVAARAIINSTKIKSININKMAKKSKLATFQEKLNKLFGEPVANKVIFSADEKELNFPDLAEDAVIEVGAKATLNGEPVGGTEEEPAEVVGQDGNVYVFVDSILTAINEATEEEEEVTEELIDALSASLDFMQEISDRVEALSTEVAGVKTERDDYKAKLETADKLIAKLKGSSTTPKEDKTDKTKEVATAVSKWREAKKNRNVKNK